MAESIVLVRWKLVSARSSHLECLKISICTLARTMTSFRQSENTILL